MKKRPHIIIFNPDEMRADALAHLGNPAAITPNLDAFARKDAVSFRYAFCQNPVCVPSRISFFTGLYPHVHGHRTMSYLLQPGEESLFSELKEAGYYVWMNTRNDLFAGQIEGWAESHADEIFYGETIPRAPGPENENYRGDPGGKNYYSHFHGRLKTDETGRNYSDDDAVVDAAIERLLNPVDDRPICAFLGLIYPHTPYAVEEPYYSAIDRSKLPPRVRPEECTGKPKMQQLLRENQNMQDYTEEDWNELRAVYLGMCMKIDEQFGRLCNALKEAGIYDDCAIFFLSDHGDYAGDYSLPEKAQNCFEDCLTRVPFLIKPPKSMQVDPGISDSLVELVDFYATVASIAGVKAERTHFGKDLSGVIADRSQRVRDYVFCEGGRLPGEWQSDEFHIHGEDGPPKDFVYWPRQNAQLDDEAHAKATMIRNERYKYIRRMRGNDEFYDLQIDPQEKCNLINNPEYEEQIRIMQMEMLKWYQETCDVVPPRIDSRFTRKMIWTRIVKNVPPENMKTVKKLFDAGASMAELSKYTYK